jgi:hypothetical protein
VRRSYARTRRLACTSVLLAQVLLLDELTTFLDADDQRSVLDAVRAAVDGPQRVTALWVRRSCRHIRKPTCSHNSTQVTHRLEELDFADAASYMEGGSIVRAQAAAWRAPLDTRASQVRTGSGADMRRWAEKQTWGSSASEP